LTSLIKNIHKIKSKTCAAGSKCQSDEVIEILLDMIAQNDNSYNHFDDSQYLSFIIGSLLQTYNPMFTYKILKVVEELLEKEIINPSYQHLVLCNILKYLHKFCMSNKFDLEHANQNTPLYLLSSIK